MGSKFLENKKEVAYLVGCLRDGYICRRDYSIGITQNDRKWLEYLQRLFYKNFRAKSRIRNFRNSFELRIFSKEIALFFHNSFEAPMKRGEWKTPEAIRKNRKLWKPYISGFFDAEGHCTKPQTFIKTGKKKVSFHQNSLETLEFIKVVLEKNGIETGKIYLQKGRKCHALYIQSKEGIINFASFVEPMRKRKELDSLVDILVTPKLVPPEMSLSSASPELCAR
jgi:hypothetical protein